MLVTGIPRKLGSVPSGMLTAKDCFPPSVCVCMPLAFGVQDSQETFVSLVRVLYWKLHYRRLARLP